MKKVLSVLLLVFTLSIIISCKKDKNEEPQSLVEKWFFEKVIYEVYNASGVLINVETDVEWTSNDHLFLQPDGKFELVQNGEKINGTYKIENSIMQLSYREVIGNASISVTKEANVIEKSSSKFIFFVEETDGSGMYKATIHLKK